jgi:hypothetical protein
MHTWLTQRLKNWRIGVSNSDAGYKNRISPVNFFSLLLHPFFFIDVNTAPQTTHHWQKILYVERTVTLPPPSFHFVHLFLFYLTKTNISNSSFRLLEIDNNNDNNNDDGNDDSTKARYRPLRLVLKFLRWKPWGNPRKIFFLHELTFSIVGSLAIALVKSTISWPGPWIHYHWYFRHCWTALPIFIPWLCTLD